MPYGVDGVMDRMRNFGKGKNKLKRTTLILPESRLLVREYGCLFELIKFWNQFFASTCLDMNFFLASAANAASNSDFLPLVQPDCLKHGMKEEGPLTKEFAI